VEKTKKDGATHDHLTDQVTTVDALVNPQSELNKMSSKTIANVGIHANSKGNNQKETNSSQNLTTNSKYPTPTSK